MKITKILSVTDIKSYCHTVYRVESDGKKTYIQELVPIWPYDPTDEDQELEHKPVFEVIKKSQVNQMLNLQEMNQVHRKDDLKSFLESLKKGEQDLHPLSVTQYFERINQKRRATFSDR